MGLLKHITYFILKWKIYDPIIYLKTEKVIYSSCTCIYTLIEEWTLNGSSINFDKYDLSFPGEIPNAKLYNIMLYRVHLAMYWNEFQNGTCIYHISTTLRLYFTRNLMSITITFPYLALGNIIFIVKLGLKGRNHRPLCRVGATDPCAGSEPQTPVQGRSHRPLCRIGIRRCGAL